MSKFKIGDKVWFDKDKARKEGNAIAPGMCGWISNVPDGLLTISEFVCGSERVIGVKECDFIFSPDWLVEADECKFEVKVKEGRIKDVKFSGWVNKALDNRQYRLETERKERIERARHNIIAEREGWRQHDEALVQALVGYARENYQMRRFMEKTKVKDVFTKWQAEAPKEEMTDVHA